MSVRQAVQLTVNGKPRELAAPTTIEGFLKSMGIDSRFIAVAYNGEVLRKEDFPRIVLKSGDSLEIVRPVGGG